MHADITLHMGLPMRHAFLQRDAWCGCRIAVLHAAAATPSTCMHSKHCM
jgi:hypothetical protein